MQKTTIAFSLSFLAAATSAQIAPGQAARFTVGGSLSTGFSTVDTELGVSIHTTGLVNAVGIGDGVIDPVTGRIWAAGIQDEIDDWDYPWTYSVLEFEIDEGAVASQSIVASLSPLVQQGRLSAIDLDRDGNLFVSGVDEIWKIERHSFAVTLWTAGAQSGAINALTIDRETNQMWIATTASSGVREIREYDIDAGPSDGFQVLDLTAAGVTADANSLTHDDEGLLYLATRTGLYEVEPVGGAIALVPTSIVVNSLWGTMNQFSSIDYDSVNGTLHTGGGGKNLGTYWTIDPVTLDETEILDDFACLDEDTEQCDWLPSVEGVDVNDFLHTTQVFPRVASHAAGFALEVAAHGQPGDLGVSAVVELNGGFIQPIRLGNAGPCGAGGNHTTTLAIAPGQLDPAIESFGVLSGTRDPVTRQWFITDIVTVTLSP